MSAGGAAKLLANALRKTQNEPTEGFTCDLPDDNNLFKWDIYVEGPPNTLYEKGIFKLQMDFPTDYPMSPPHLKFVSEFWHPNVYNDGRVCLSILHAPGHDPMSGELPEERWLPSQTVSTIILSLISMLDEPNFSSPANVDASVQLRNQPEEYKKRVAQCIEKAKKDVPSHIVIPHPDTDPAQREKAVQKMRMLNMSLSLDDLDDVSFDEDAFFNDDDEGEFEDDYVDDDEDDGTLEMEDD